MTADSAIIAVGPPITGRVRCADGTSKHRLNLARSRETDRRKAYENRSPVFSYERSATQESYDILICERCCTSSRQLPVTIRCGWWLRLSTTCRVRSLPINRIFVENQDRPTIKIIKYSAETECEKSDRRDRVLVPEELLFIRSGN